MSPDREGQSNELGRSPRGQPIVLLPPIKRPFCTPPMSDPKSDMIRGVVFGVTRELSRSDAGEFTLVQADAGGERGLGPLAGVQRAEELPG